MSTKYIWHANDPRNPAGTGVNADPHFITYALAQAAASSGDDIVWFGNTDASGVPRIHYENISISKTLNIHMRGVVVRQSVTSSPLLAATADNFVIKGRGTWDSGASNASVHFNFGSRIGSMTGQYLAGRTTSLTTILDASNITFRRCVFDAQNVFGSFYIGNNVSTPLTFINCLFQNCPNGTMIADITGATVFIDCLFKNNAGSIANVAAAFTRCTRDNSTAFPALAVITDEVSAGSILFKDASAYNFYPESGSNVLTSNGQMGASSTGTNGRGMGASNTSLRGPNALYVHPSRTYRIVNAEDLAAFTGSGATFNASLKRWEMSASGDTVTDNTNTNKGQDLGLGAVTKYIEIFGDETNNSVADSSSVLDSVPASFSKQFSFDAHNTAPVPASVTMGDFHNDLGRYAKTVTTMRSNAV